MPPKSKRIPNIKRYTDRSIIYHITGNANVAGGDVYIVDEDNINDNSRTTRCTNFGDSASSSDSHELARRYPRLARLKSPEAHFNSTILESVVLQKGTRVNTLYQLRSAVQSVSSKNGVVVLTGTIGTGKTAICKYVAADLDKDGGRLAGAFFFHHGHAKNTVRHMILDFAASLPKVLPEYGKIVEQKLQTTSVDKSGIDTLWEKLIVGPLQTLSEDRSLEATHRLLFIIDGLDDCDLGGVIGSHWELSYFLALLSQFQAQFKSFVWVLSSRPTETLRRFLVDDQIRTSGLVRIDLDKSAAAHLDITNYVGQELDAIPFVPDVQEADESWKKDLAMMKKRIIEQAAGQFAYVVQSLLFIRHPSTSPVLQLRRLLNDESASAFLTLDHSYTNLLQVAYSAEGGIRREMQQKLLYTLAHLDLPLTVGTLCAFWGIPSEILHPSLAPLFPVLSFHDKLPLDSPIELKTTFRDFLLTSARSTTYTISTTTLALDAFIRSLSVAEAYDDPESFRDSVNGTPNLPQGIFASWLSLAIRVNTGQQETVQRAVHGLTNFQLDHWLQWRPVFRLELRERYDAFLSWLHGVGDNRLYDKYVRRHDKLPEQRTVPPGGLPLKDE